MLDDHRMVFLAGLHRSGTTFVARYLGQHPKISGLRDTGVPEDEGEHLQSVYPDSWEHGSVGRFGFAPQAHLTESSPLVTDKNRRRLLEEWSPYWDLSRPVLLEKSPPNLLKLRFLQALFPGSRAVVILRHPVAVASAHIKWRLHGTRALEPHRLVRHWVACHELFLEDLPHLSDVLLVRYEDVVREPDAQFARMFKHLGVEAPSGASPRISDENAKYFAAWRGKGPVRRAYVRAIEARYEDRIQRFGYTFEAREPLGPIEALEPAPAAG